LPAWLARPLRVEPSPLAPAAESPGPEEPERELEPVPSAR
jgi:hypothetical protein